MNTPPLWTLPPVQQPKAFLGTFAGVDIYQAADTWRQVPDLGVGGMIKVPRKMAVWDHRTCIYIPESEAYMMCGRFQFSGHTPKDFHVDGPFADQIIATINILS